MNLGTIKTPIVLYLVLSLDYGGGWAVSPYFNVYKGMNLGTMETQSCYTYIGHVWNTFIFCLHPKFEGQTFFDLAQICRRRHLEQKRNRLFT